MNRQSALLQNNCIHCRQFLIGNSLYALLQRSLDFTDYRRFVSGINWGFLYVFLFISK
jgi:hypothetical protein